MWYHEYIGGGRCPIVDTWWQTETGMILITPLPGVTTLKPGSATRAFPGIQADILTGDGERIEVGGGFLAIKRPWPSMLRGIYGDPERYVETYWRSGPAKSIFPATAPSGTRTAISGSSGRVDDVLNVSGHRIGTMEVESALVDYPGVAEAAVVGNRTTSKGRRSPPS